MIVGGKPPEKNMAQSVDLYQPIVSSKAGPAPITLRVGVTSNNYIAGGVPAATVKGETYVLLSALPQELQERVKSAVQMLLAGI